MHVMRNCATNYHQLSLTVLNWDNLNLTIPFVVAGLIVGLPLVHAFIWVLHLLRDRLLVVNNENLEIQDTHRSQWNPTFVLEENRADCSTVVIKSATPLPN